MIKIITQLNAGIYRSHGGGKKITHFSWSTGPRNLLKAIAVFDAHYAEMQNAFGVVGSGFSWIDIDGLVLTVWDVIDFEVDEDSPMQKARTILSRDIAHVSID